MAKFSYVNKEKQLVEFSFNDIKPENPINDFIQNNSVDDSYDFDELTTNGIYLFQNISKINNEVKHRPAALAGSGQLFFFSEEPSKANRIVFQLVFSDSDESKLHYRRGMANSAGLQFEEWQSTSRSTEAASNFAISKVSPASIVGGSWIKNSSVPASMVWEHSGVSTYVNGQTSGMNVLLNLETFALSASQEVYIKESGAFQKMTLGIGCGGTGSTTAEGARNALGAASQTDLNSLRDSVSYKYQLLQLPNSNGACHAYYSTNIPNLKILNFIGFKSTNNEFDSYGRRIIGYLPEHLYSRSFAGASFPSGSNLFIEGQNQLKLDSLTTGVDTPLYETIVYL